MRNSIAKATLGIATTLLAAGPAKADPPASTGDASACRTELEAHAPAAAPAPAAVVEALAEMGALLRQVPAPASDSMPDRLVNWFRLGRFRRATKALFALPMSASDRKAACARFVAAAGDLRLVNRQPRVIGPILERLCAPDAHAARMAVTRQALDTPAMAFPSRYLNAGTVRTDEGDGARRWLLAMIDGTHLSTPDWMDLLDPARPERVIALADAVEGRWENLGMDLDQVREVAGRVLRSGVSLSALAHWMSVPGEELDALVPAMNPLQWFELMHLRGHLKADLAAPLQLRLAAAGPIGTTHYQAQAVNALEDIVLDTTVPFAAVDQTFARIEKAWPKLYGKGAKLSLAFPDRALLTREQEERVNRFQIGRVTTRENELKLEGRARARSSLRLKKPGEFTTAAELADAFDLRALYPADGDKPDAEEAIRRREVSATYRRQLMRTIKDMKARGIELSAKDVKDLQKITVALPAGLQPKRKK